MELFSQYAVAAAKEAIEQSGLDMTKEDPFRVGCSVGSGIGSMQVVDEILRNSQHKGTRKTESSDVPLLSPIWLLEMFPFSLDSAGRTLML